HTATRAPPPLSLHDALPIYAAPNIRVRTSEAFSEGSALTTTPFSPSRSCTLDCLTSRPLLMTPTRSQICSTSPRRWLERSTVRRSEEHTLNSSPCNLVCRLL